MAFLDFISTRDKSTATTPSQTQTAPGDAGKKPTATTPHSDDPAAAKSTSSPPTSDPKPVPQAHKSEAPPVAGQSDSATRIGSSTDANRRWSIQGQFKLLRKPTIPRSTVEKHDAAARTAATTGRVKLPSALSNADRRAKQSALVVRSLIVGQDTEEGGVASPQVPISNSQLKNVKAQLLKPKSANKVIAELRALPSFANSTSHASQPIQAVCLPYGDEEADGKRFGTLRNVKPPPPTTTPTTGTPSTSPKGSSPIDAITDAFKTLHIVNLFTAPGLGLGDLGGGEGILAGALPSAETVINGFTQITPQLMALGYTAGKSLAPSHKGIYPPTDRLSVLTCTLLVYHHVAEISRLLCRLVGSRNHPTSTDFGIPGREFHML
jgi:hypothetical protein